MSWLSVLNSTRNVLGWSLVCILSGCAPPEPRTASVPAAAIVDTTAEEEPYLYWIIPARRELPDGEYARSYPSGRRAVSGMIRNGKQEGLWTFWFPDGRTGREGDFVAGKEEGPWRVWDLNDHSRWGVVEYRDGQMEGDYIMRFEDGTTWREGTMIHGGLSGRYVEYYPNGVLREICSYGPRGMIGPLEYYYENGHPSRKGSFVDGQADGEWSWWHENGLPSAHGVHERAVATGPWAYWTPDGALDPWKSGEYVRGHRARALTGDEASAALASFEVR